MEQQITLDNIRAYARKLSARLDESCLPILGVYMPQTKSQEKEGIRADYYTGDVIVIYKLMKNWETFHSLKSTIKKKQIESFIRNKISTDDRWALRTLIIMYEHQTADEKRVEQTNMNNSIGFTGFDAKLMTSFAKQYLSRAKDKELDARHLSKKQMEIVKKTMQKYWKQVYNNSDELKLLQQVAADIAKSGTQLSMNI
jgi:hypothetical protein